MRATCGVSSSITKPVCFFLKKKESARRIARGLMGEAALIALKPSLKSSCIVVASGQSGIAESPGLVDETDTSKNLWGRKVEARRQTTARS